VSIALTCLCGRQFNVNDKFAGQRVMCPACADAMDVPRLATRAPGAPASRQDAVRGGAPPVRARSAKPPPLPVDKLVASPMHRFVWLWLGIAAVVPVAVVTVAFGLYLLLSRAPVPVVADKGEEKQPVPQAVVPPAKVKLKTNVHPQAKAAAQPKNEAQAGLTQRVHDMFKANCYRCHGQDGENEGGLNYVADLRTLVSRNKVVPGKPEESVVFHGEPPADAAQGREGSPHGRGHCRPQAVD
jgi:mono/diheme cytochrome c family protein